MSFDFFLPVLTYPDPTPIAGLTRALDMAASIGGRVSPLVAEIDIPPLHNVLADLLINVSAMADEAERKSREAGDQLAAELEHLGRRLSLPLTLARRKCTAVALPDMLATEARIHDCTLLVVDPAGQGHLELTEAILFGSGGPALVCPALDAPGHLMSVTIAWDGSRASARTVRDALPVLKRARSTCILTLNDDKQIEQKSVDGLQAFLSYHGIASVHTSRRRETASAGLALQAFSLELGAGLLVMGAYGHSRLREFVLGGATASVLQDSQLPIFMSH